MRGDVKRELTCLPRTNALGAARAAGRRCRVPISLLMERDLAGTIRKRDRGSWIRQPRHRVHRITPGTGRLGWLTLSPLGSGGRRSWARSPTIVLIPEPTRAARIMRPPTFCGRYSAAISLRTAVDHPSQNGRAERLSLARDVQRVAIQLESHGTGPGPAPTGK
jgi:hypothetical protein